jgi:hypothetical protein
MSKFEYANFYDGIYGTFAVNKEKYSKEEAIKLFEYENGCIFERDYVIVDAYAIHRAGISENGPCVGWWLEDNKRLKRSVPVWAFERKIQ